MNPRLTDTPTSTSSVDLPQGRVAYRAAGPETSTAPPVVFLHGLFVDARLWTPVADLLATAGVRSYAVDLPLGAHTTALHADADTTVDGVLDIVAGFLAALELTDVTLVGNDTGGGLSQLLVDRDDSRIGRLLLTNCDAFDTFPPFPFGALTFGRTARRVALMMRVARPRLLRHSVLGYGGLAGTPLDAGLTRSWVDAALSDEGVARDVAKFLGSIDSAQLADAATRLPLFGKPVRLVWGDRDPFFRISLAERLRDTFPDAELVRVRGGRTFVPLDFPEVVAHQIADFGAADG